MSESNGRVRVWNDRAALVQHAAGIATGMVVASFATGVTRVVATGEAWEQLPTKVVGPTA